MSIPGAASPLFIGAAAAAEAGYQIDRSLRFNSGDSAYLNRTPSSAGNRKTWTWSGWVKFTNFSTASRLFAAGANNDNRTIIHYDSSNKNLKVFSTVGGTQKANLSTDAVFRDPSSFYHIVVSFDAANTNVDIYINGVEQALTTSTSVANENHNVNNTVAHKIGQSVDGNVQADLYLAETHFVDGQALAASDFGEYDDNNVWQPKEFTNHVLAEANGATSPTVIIGESSANIDSGNVLYLNSNPDSATYPIIYNSASGEAERYRTIKVKFHSAISSVTSIKFRGGGVSGGENYTLYVNGTQVGGTHTTNSQWSEDSHTITSTDVTEIKIIGAAGFALGQLKLNDSLVSGTPSYGTHAEGTNSFYLKFADNSSNAALGTDSSGNSNTWTVNNLSVASGAGNDSLIDTPTNYTASSGNNGGNYCTFNPLLSNGTLSNGNLDVTTNLTGDSHTHGTIAFPSSGKWYYEITPTASGNQAYIYIGDGAANVANSVLYYGNDGKKRVDGTFSTYGATYGNNDVIGVAVNVDDGEVTFYKNGASQGAISYTISGKTLFPAVADGSSGAAVSFSANFGQRPFAYTPPTGFVSLCTTNLPDPTIADGSTAFDTSLWTGNGETGQSITGLSFSPDLVWIKSRSFANNHHLFDSVRGVNKILRSSSTAAEDGTKAVMPAFNSDGFDVDEVTGNNATNDDGSTFVGWTWDAGSSTVSNTDGSITSSVRANASAGFSIVGWAGTGATATIGHGLNSNPYLYIIKNRSLSVDWKVYTTVIDGSLDFGDLNTTSAFSNSSISAPTSSVFSVINADTINQSGSDYIAYCFAPVEGYSAFGSYTGNGSTDGPFVFTGFKPRWILFKNASSSTYGWYLLDTARDEYNVAATYIFPDSSDAEGTGAVSIVDFLSNGFKPRAQGAYVNASGDTYIYAAFSDKAFSLNGGLAR